MRAAVLLVLSALLAACGPSDPPTIDRETFVTVYVELREAALRTPGGVIEPAARDEVLARHGLSEQDLVTFAEVHGDNVRYMAGVWREIEARLEPDPAAAGTP